MLDQWELISVDKGKGWHALELAVAKAGKCISNRQMFDAMTPNPSVWRIR